MNCMKESEIQWIVSWGMERELRGLEPPDPELDDLKSHATTCHRCAELLNGFLVVERGFRREVGAWEGAKWIRLVEIEDASGRGYPDEDAEEEPFRLAAATPQLTNPSAFGALGPRLFQSEDGAIEVALQPAAEGTGYLAILTRGWPEPGPEGQIIDELNARHSRQIGLTCGLGVYWFGDNRRVHLPAARIRSLFLVKN